MNAKEKSKYEEAIRKFVGKRVKVARTIAELPANETARRARISRSTLYRIEQGETDAPITTLALIAWATGTTLQHLIGYPEVVAGREWVGAPE